MHELPASYAGVYDNLLEAVATSPLIKTDTLTAFWPMRGHRYDGDLFVIGRTTNGWHETWEKQDAVGIGQRQRVLKRTRGHSEPRQLCPLLWVTDQAGSVESSTNASAFWRVIKRVTLEGNRDQERVEAWPSWICWSNLLKIAPKSMKTPPPAPLKQVQLPYGVRLLAQELDEFNPRRVLVLAGADWFSPFAQDLGLDVTWRAGLVEGVAKQAERHWVIAKHPVGKLEDDLVDEVMEAFAGRLQV